VYSKFGVKEYWVVDPAARQVEVYRLQENTLVLEATLGEEQQITSMLMPGYNARVGDFFV